MLDRVESLLRALIQAISTAYARGCRPQRETTREELERRERELVRYQLRRVKEER